MFEKIDENDKNLIQNIENHLFKTIYLNEICQFNIPIKINEIKYV
jgi:hypothetical protein